MTTHRVALQNLPDSMLTYQDTVEAAATLYLLIGERTWFSPIAPTYLDNRGVLCVYLNSGKFRSRSQEIHACAVLRRGARAAEPVIENKTLDDPRSGI